MKRVIFWVALIISLVLVGGISFLSNVEIYDSFPEVVATNFVGYDLARAIAPDGVRVEMLVKPGVELHSFEPSVRDIKNLEKAKLIILNGGESDEWAERLIESNTELEKKTLRMMNFVEVVPEGETLAQETDGDKTTEEGEGSEVDEHIWTSPVNVIKILGQINNKLAEIFPEEASEISLRTDQYAEEFNQIDLELREIITNAQRKKIVVGDRFPFAYLVKEYGLEYLAAFPGCAESTEVNPQVLAEMIRVVSEEKIPVVYKIELSSGVIAEEIARETGARLLELHSGHNISEKEFREGVTFADLMRRNVGVLREGLR